MAKHDQRWRDARWKQKKRQRDAESKRREWELSEFARQADEALEHMRQFTDWAEPMIERLDFLKEIGPGVNFAEILEGTKYRFVWQKYNGDGTGVGAFCGKKKPCKSSAQIRLPVCA